MAIQTRVGWRSYVATTPVVSVSSLLTSLYSVWDGDISGASLDTSIFGAWNAEANNNVNVKNAWNANGNANDSKGSANGTIATPSGTSFTTGTMSFAAGKIGTGAFTFNGSNFVSLPADTFAFTGDFSISFWAYIPTNGCNLVSAFDNKLTYTQGRGWSLGASSTQLSFYTYQNAYSTNYYGIKVNYSSHNQWAHIVLTRKKGTQAKIYVNGVLQTIASVDASTSTEASDPLYATSHLSYIGASFYSFQQPYYGTTANNGLKIDSLYTFEVELDQTAVNELYNSGSGQEYPFTTANALIASPKDSVSANHGTLNGGMTYTTGKIGNAFTFNGTNAYVSFPNNSLNLTGDFSISAWVYFPTDNQLIGSDYSYILTNWTAVTWSTNLAGWRFGTNGNSITFITYNGTATTLTLDTGLGGMLPLDRNGWRHIVVTKSGTTYKLWLDGGQYTATSTTMLEPKYTGTITPKIGRAGDSTMQGWDSYGSSKIKIDELNVWSKALTSDEISTLYNSGNGTQYPYSSQTLAAPSNKLGIDNGTLMNGCSIVPGKIGNAFSFDGVNDYVALPDNSLNLIGDFTISVWVYHTATGFQTIIANQFSQTTPSVISRGWALSIAGQSGAGSNITFNISKDSTTAYNNWQFGSLTLNAWNHVVIKRVSGDNTYCWINGVAQTYTLYVGTGTAQPTVDPIYNTIQYNSIGAQKYAASSINSYMKSGSKIDAVNVWNRALTTAEITELYNSGNGKQLSPTSIVTSGLVLNLDASRKSSYPNTGTTWYDISGNGYNGTMANGVSYRTTASGVMSFDGVNDYIQISNSPSLGSSNFSIEIWFKRNSNSVNWNNTFLFSKWNTGASPGSNEWSVYFGSPDATNYGDYIQFVLESGNGIYNIVGGNIIVNTWNHFVVTRENGTLKTYINGVLTKTLTPSIPTYGSLDTKSINNVGRTLKIASSDSNQFFSYVDVQVARMYNKTLSATEITQNFNATKSRFGL